MTSDWIEVALEDLVHIKHGFAFKGQYFSEASCRNAVITPGNFAVGGGYQEKKIKYYNGPIPEGYLLQGGDLVVSMTDLSKTADTLGYAAIIPHDLNYSLLHNQRIGLVLPRSPGNVSRFFLHWLMRSNSYRSEVLASATGSTVRHTSPSRIGAFRFLLPPIDEQRRIAAVLGALDDKIELNRKMNRTLEEMAQALFKSWFIDFDGHDDLVDSELGPIPRGWGVRSLLDSAAYVNGAAYRAFCFNSARLGLPVVKIAELKTGLTQNTKFTSTKMPDKYHIYNREMLFSWSGNPDTSIDTFIWTRGPALLNQHIFRVIPLKPLEWHFIYLLLKSLRPVFAEIARDKQTTGLGHVTKRDMERTIVPLPPSGVLEQFNTMAGPLFERWYNNIIESQTLAELRDTLLPKLISGEFRVPEAEALTKDLS